MKIVHVGCFPTNLSDFPCGIHFWNGQMEIYREVMSETINNKWQPKQPSIWNTFIPINLMHILTLLLADICFILLASHLHKIQVYGAKDKNTDT